MWCKCGANVTEETCCFFPLAVRTMYLGSLFFSQLPFALTYTAAVLYYATAISATYLHFYSQILYEFVEHDSTAFLSQLYVI